MAFRVDGNSIVTYAGKLDVSTKKETSGVSAMKKFQSLDRQALSSSDTSLGTLHQNAITSLCLHTGTKAGANKFSTTGIDGLVAVWEFKVCLLIFTLSVIYSLRICLLICLIVLSIDYHLCLHKLRSNRLKS